MSPSRRWFVAVVFMVGCATGAMVKDLIIPAHAQGRPPVIYQYKVVRARELLPTGENTGDKMVNAINRFGAQGWRLAAIDSGDTSAISLYYFEKALPSTAGSPAPVPVPLPAP